MQDMKNISEINSPYILIANREIKCLFGIQFSPNLLTQLFIIVRKPQEIAEKE